MKLPCDSGRVGRIFCCLLVALLPLRAVATAPPTTLVSEGLFGMKSGAEKKQSALNFIGATISLAEAVTNRDVVDVDKLRDGLPKIIDGTVQCLNASTWAKQ